MRGIGKVRGVCGGRNRSLRGDRNHRSCQLAPQHVSAIGKTDLVFKQVREAAGGQESQLRRLIQRHSQVIATADGIEDLGDPLVQAARRRGVRVVVLVPGAIDHNIVRQASRRQFGRLLRAGIQIYEYGPALLHSKTMVIDGVWTTIGSTNLDNRSFAVNDELNVIVYSREVAQRMETVFADDIALSRQVTYKDWKSRGMAAKLLETLALPIRDLL